MNLQKLFGIFALTLLVLGASLNTLAQSDGYRISAPVSYKNLSEIRDVGYNFRH